MGIWCTLSSCHQGRGQRGARRPGQEEPGATLHGAAATPDRQTNLICSAPPCQHRISFFIKRPFGQKCPNDVSACWLPRGHSRPFRVAERAGPGRAPQREEAGDKGLSPPRWTGFGPRRPESPPESPKSGPLSSPPVLLPCSGSVHTPKGLTFLSHTLTHAYSCM